MAGIDDKLSYEVIGFAMEAHRELGPGLDEFLYHTLIGHHLTAAGIEHRIKPRGQLIHRGIVADEFEPDLIVAEALVVELKVLWGGFIPEHLLQIICYLKFWRLPTGLIFDFGKESLVQKRVPLLNRPADIASIDLSKALPSLCEMEQILKELTEVVRVILAEYGLGYRDTTYRGLLVAEMSHRGIPVCPEPVVAVRGGGILLGESKLFSCLVLPGKGALFVTALRESRQAADRAVLQAFLQHLDLPWGFHLNFGKSALSIQVVTRPDFPRG